MAVAETVVLGFSAAVCVLLGYMIRYRGAVGLIAGYNPGDLPPAEEDSLARDASRVTFVAAALIVAAIVQEWTRPVPGFWTGFTGIVFALSGWVVWKYNR